jgi:hypothetical protein
LCRLPGAFPANGEKGQLSSSQSVHLLKEPRPPIPATAEHAKCVDYEYERAATAMIFMFTEPLAGWREVAVRERKTKLDWATGNGPTAGGTLCGVRKNDLGVRQPEYAHDRRVIRGV